MDVPNPDDIYIDEKYNYYILEEDKRQLLDIMKKEFGIMHEIVPIPDKPLDTIIRFSKDFTIESCTLIGYWGCLPPLSNYKYIIDKFLRCENLDGAFSGSNSDKLCQVVHYKSTQPIVRNWQFRYRAYKKQRVIQLKPHHDPENHFSIIWSKKKGISHEEFLELDSLIRKYITEHDNQMTFRLIKVCKNCTYGRFDQEFEDLIVGLRRKYKLCTDKDLTLGDPKHNDIRANEIWDIDHPIIHHIHGKSSTNDPFLDKEFEEIVRSPKNSTLILQIELLPTV